MITEEIDQAAEQEQSEQLTIRRQKLEQLRQQGIAYPNDFKPNGLVGELVAQYGELNKESLEQADYQTKVAGRMMTRRLMGKASFVHMQDMSGRMQIYLRENDLPEGQYQQFKGWDLGDIIGVEGTVFKTKTGELTVKASNVRLLTKALRPLPDKFHGLSDHETRYRQRYLDLLANEDSRRIFEIRSKTVAGIRKFLADKGFLEVETPMMHTLPGGAAARPFVTHHNALDMELHLRIAPELFLKRLVVGGFERVFEINRNFRNEGLSTRHNPEFTMLEFYQAYADYNDLMDLTEAMFRELAREVLGSAVIKHQGMEINVEQPFKRLPLTEAILHYNPDISAKQLSDLTQATVLAKKLGIAVQAHYGLGKLQMEIFEKTTEEKVMEPTFITQYSTEVSPLARKNDQNPFFVDRFEFFVGGREIANGFSE
ncbi:MAG TPA: lysine--tRNA ligase, partial [Gammaproteobacteria bacterium]|nr:lysine--tRNA ligase [Gammaproteobacteria bacterium]